jgi:glycosyltransferase involved in cell wall biosynthesis
MRRKVLIVTLNDYIIYQPTILNLYDLLVPDMDVQIISFKPSYVTTTRDDTRNITYIDPPRFSAYFISKFDFLFSKVAKLIRAFNKRYSYQYRYYNVFLPGLLKHWLKKHETDTDIVIAVDLAALRIAQEIYDRVHFLSLEIDNRESNNYSGIDESRILSVLIQSRARLEYVFPGLRSPAFIVQNSPIYNESLVNRGQRQHFVFAGTARAVFGIFECIEFIKEYPPAHMVQKGGGEKKVLAHIRDQYAQLILDGRLRLDSNYLSSENFISFLSRFRIGFCFYSWDWIGRFFNYRTAPSGKLFMYMAAGVPVIASDIEGFQLVREFNAGVLVNDYNPQTIDAAVKKIEADYPTYSQNCLKLARELSFDKLVAPYIEFLKSS